MKIDYDRDCLGDETTLITKNIYEILFYLFDK